MHQHHIPHFVVADIGAIALIIGSAFDKLPAIAAGIACIWYCILIFDRIFTKPTNKDQD